MGVGARADVVDEISVLESLVLVVAEVNFSHVVVDRQVMQVAVPAEVQPVQVYREFLCERIVSKLVGVVVRISVQLVQG